MPDKRLHASAADAAEGCGVTGFLPGTRRAGLLGGGELPPPVSTRTETSAATTAPTIPMISRRRRRRRASLNRTSAGNQSRPSGDPEERSLACSGERLDESNHLSRSVALVTGELEKLSNSLDNRSPLGRPGHGNAPTTPELQ